MSEARIASVNVNRTFLQIRDAERKVSEAKAIAPTADECKNPVTPAEIAPEAVQTPVEDEIAANDEPTEKETQWAWSKATKECLGKVVGHRCSEIKLKRSGESVSRAKWYPLQKVTFENPVTPALSLDVSPLAGNQWREDDQFLEELDD